MADPGRSGTRSAPGRTRAPAPPSDGIAAMELTEFTVPGYERVLRAEEPSKGWCAIVAIHDTTLGPALGGLRMWKYASKDEALTDVLRLARGMTFKSAVARTGLGGGKS